MTRPPSTPTPDLDLEAIREFGPYLQYARDIRVDSGVEPDSLEFCLETLLADAPFRAARAAIRVVQGDDLRVIYLEVEEEEGAEEGPVGETAPGAASGP